MRATEPTVFGRLKRPAISHESADRQNVEKLRDAQGPMVDRVGLSHEVALDLGPDQRERSALRTAVCTALSSCRACGGRAIEGLHLGLRLWLRLWLRLGLRP